MGPAAGSGSKRSAGRRQAGPPETAAARRPGGRAVWGALLIVYVVWGSTYLGIRVVVRDLPPFLSAAMRFLLAGSLMAGLVLWRQGAGALRVTPRQLGSAGLVGLLLLLGGNGMVVLGETSVPSGLTALLIAVVPVWVVLLRALQGDRSSRQVYLGVVLGLAGLVVLFVPGISGGVRMAGVLSVVTASLLWSVGSISSARLPMPRSPFAASAYEMLAGGVGCLLVGLFRGEQHSLRLTAVSGEAWLALAYLVVFGSLVAFSAYAWLLQHAPLPLVATYAYVNPVVAVLLGTLLLGEPLGWPMLVGGAVVVAGVWLVVGGNSSSR